MADLSVCICGIIKPCYRNCEEKKMENREPNQLEKDDLETVDSYIVVCSECNRATIAYESWADALSHANAEGFRRCNDDTYCQPCLPIAQQRWAEEDEADRYFARRHDESCRCENCESDKTVAVVNEDKDTPGYEERLAEFAGTEVLR